MWSNSVYNEAMLLVVALLPFVLLFILMAVLNRPAYIAAPVTAVVTTASAYLVWGVPVNWLSAALVRGLGVTVDIMLVIIGAIFLITTLRHLGLFDPMQQLFARVSKDKRVQAILVCWFFVAFIEGIAGFGTPAMLAIPILLALGFSPIISVVLALVGDSIVVVFGAVGVPISIGIAEGVGLPSDVSSVLSSHVAIGSALFNVLLGWMIPLFISVIVSREYTGSWWRGLELWPLAVFSGLVYALPALAAAYWLTPEFPTILGALVGGSVTSWMLYRGWFVPRDLVVFDSEVKHEVTLSYKNIVKLLLPYALIILGLLMTRLPELQLRELLRGYSFEISNLFGTGFNASVAWAFSPGVVFIIVAVLIIWMYGQKFSQVGVVGLEAGRRVAMPFVGLFFVLAIVQIMLLSYYNTNGLPSMPLYLAERLAILGEAWPLVAPFVGVVGAFIAGSATVSNLLFASLQYTTATAVGVSAVLVLSLQAVGGALGNMIAVHNILAAQAVSGLSGKEGEILRRTLVPVLLYGSVLAVSGYIISIFI